jgi:hypothetical protein
MTSTPEASITDTFEVRMLAMMAKFNQPIWDTIHRIEQALGNGRIPRILQRAGPRYWSEHIVNQAPRVSSIVAGPVVTTQDTEPRQDNQVAPPFPSEAPVPERSLPSANPAAIVWVDDDEEFPALEPMSRGQRRRHNNAVTALNQRHLVPGAVGPDDGHIALTNNNSRIKPLFANVITREAVAQQQNIKTSAAQARQVQGRKPSGGQGPHRTPADGNMTEVTVIRFGGLENEEEECKFRARNPVEIIQSVQRDLARLAKNPPAVLSGRWSTTSNTTTLTHGVRMFSAQVKFLRCGDNPTLLQCSRCHLLGHYASSAKCKLPKNAIKCYRCRGKHDGRDHDYECDSKSHKTIGKCDCSLKCLLCKKTDHHAHSCKCLKRGNFNPPRLPERDESEPFQIVGRKRNTKGKQRAAPYSPPLSSFVIPEVKTIPLPQRPTEKDKNVLLCMCCPLPSMAEYQKRFVSPRPNVTDTTALPTACIISSKGKSIVELYLELGQRKAYGTAILAGNEDACAQLLAMDKHDDNEVLELLHEAEEEVVAEIEINQAIDTENRGDDYFGLHIPQFDNIPVTRDGTHPPIGVEALILNHILDKARTKGADMGWGPSVSMITDA